MQENYLQIIPEYIGLLHRLKSLWFYMNEVTQFPESLLICDTLEDLQVCDNLITRLPISIPTYLSRLSSFRAISRYNRDRKVKESSEKPFKELYQGEKFELYPDYKYSKLADYMKRFVNETKTVKLNQCRIMFMGDGNVGKTTLCTCHSPPNPLTRSEQYQSHRHQNTLPEAR